MKKYYLFILALLISLASFGQGPITGTFSVCVGSTTTLNCTPPGGTWASSNPSTATIGSTNGVVTGVAPGVVTITYFVVGAIVVATFTVNPLPGAIACPTTGMGCVVCAGDSILLTDPTPGGTWSSGNPSIGTVGSTSGYVTGVSAGIVTITYTLGTGCFVTTAVTVCALPAVFTVTGGGSYCSGGIGVAVGLGGSQTGVTYQLLCSGSPVGLPVAGTGSAISFGLQTSPCVYTVVATNACGCTDTMTGSATVIVNPMPGPIVCPTSGCVVCAGDSITLIDAVPGGTWSSSSTTIATAGSLSGIVTGISAGIVTITYTLPGGCFVTTTVTVCALPIVYNVTGGGSYCSGGSGVPVGLSNSQVGVNYQLLCSGSPVGLPVAGTGSAISFGLQTSACVYQVVATNACGCTDTMAGSATVVINPTPMIVGALGTVFRLCVGQSQTLTAVPSGGTWTSSNTAIATVGSSSGVVTAISTGVCTITYTLPTGCFTTITLTVNPNPGPITGTTTVCVGATTLLSCTPPGGLWSSSNPAIATVVATSGLVTGVSAGIVTITYTISTGCFSVTTVTVNPAPTPITGTTIVCVGGSTTLSNGVAGGIWSSSNTSVATVGSSSGVVAGVSAGIATITYTLPNGCFATVAVTVITSPAPIIGPTSGNRVCIGGTITLTDATPSGTWSSSNTAVATVGSSTGVVTGVSAGVVTITYSLGGSCYVTTTVTVNPLPAPITGPNHVCAGFSIGLSDITPGGTWSTGCGNANVGSGTGIVNGISAGPCVITYTLPTGCFVTYSVTVTPAPCATLDINEKTAINGGVEVFPNPAFDELTVRMDEGAYNSFTITNSVGQVLIQQTLRGKETTVNVKALPAAIYYIILRGENGVTVKRFVKN